MTDMKVWAALWAEINTPDDFYQDPYGEATNQLSHAALGALIVIAFCFAYEWWWGEFPMKPVAAIVVTLPYLLGEIFDQRWRGWDTIADVYFYSIGGYVVLASLSEVRAYERILLEPNPEAFGAFFAALFIGLAIRIYPRAARKYGAK